MSEKPSDETRDVEVEARDHHYQFAHGLLPHLLLRSEDPWLSLLAGQDGEAVLLKLWESVGASLPPALRLSPTGLAHEFRSFGDDHLIMLVTLPPVLAPPEAVRCVLTLSPEFRLFLQEHSDSDDEGNPTWCYCEWTEDGVHVNRGALPRGDLSEFLSAIALTLDLPLGNVLQPVAGPYQAVAYEAPTRIELDDAQEAQLNRLSQEEHAAMEQRDWPRCEAASRALLAFFLEQCGPTDGDTLMTYGDIATALLHQGRAADAEAVARAFWALCRRYRPPAHAETDQAVRLVAKTLLAQGGMVAAGRLLKYRVQLAVSMRGHEHKVAVHARADLKEFEGA